MNERRLQKRIELDAAPEEVWQAIATGPGIACWFVPHEVEPREGGVVEQDYGGGFTTRGRVTAWEPGRRFAYGAFDDQPEGGGAQYAYEFLVEGRDGGGTVLRFVQSGFLDGADWDDEYDAFDVGWELFFTNLRSYLRHFCGRSVRTVVAMGWASADGPPAWEVLHRALGLSAHPALGDTVTLAGPEPVTGVVDVATPGFLGVRSADGLHRIGAEGLGGACEVSAYHYFYDRPVDAAALSAAWQAWLSTLFPRPDEEASA